ncbi:hypothetical protein B0J12DRAFT_705665 [Macrophomina phaseolina]|uniref:Uncharacterized protein n=1 Tax=Macrophomina phaseolina TaxID=35725 RepID=A0ABQ8FRL0_9PEZI|nr:hypothetical protein B0J12DRAFT_705665 [Macrophomina phaseolina]
MDFNETTPELSDEFFASLFPVDDISPTPSTDIDSWLYPAKIDQADNIASSPLNRFHERSIHTRPIPASLDQQGMVPTISPGELMLPQTTSFTHNWKGRWGSTKRKRAGYGDESRPQLIISEAGHAFVEPVKTLDGAFVPKINRITSGKKRKKVACTLYGEGLTNTMANKGRTSIISDKASCSSTLRERLELSQPTASLPKDSHDAESRCTDCTSGHKRCCLQSNIAELFEFQQDMELDYHRRISELKTLQGQVIQTLLLLRSMQAKLSNKVSA